MREESTFYRGSHWWVQVMLDNQDKTPPINEIFPIQVGGHYVWALEMQMRVGDPHNRFYYRIKHVEGLKQPYIDCPGEDEKVFRILDDAAKVNLEGIKQLEIHTCSWCIRRATAKGDDGTYSCGQGQGDGLESHNTLGVTYMPFPPITSNREFLCDDCAPEPPFEELTIGWFTPRDCDRCKKSVTELGKGHFFDQEGSR